MSIDTKIFRRARTAPEGGPAPGLWGAALAGALIYLALFIYCLAANYGFAVMGVEDPRLTRLAKAYLLWPFLSFEVKVLAAYLAVGAANGLVSALLVRGLLGILKKEVSSGSGLLLAIVLILVIHALTFARAVVMYPQIFTEFLYEKGGLGRELQILLTDRVGLWPLDAALIVILIAGVMLWAAAALRPLPGGGMKAAAKWGLAALAALAGSALVYAAAIHPSYAHRNTGPNILIVAADSLRPDRLSAYGFERDTSPALKKLAEQGVRFDQAYSQLPRTFPAWVSVFTGLYPFQHGITSMFPSVASRQKDFNALPEILAKNGWETAVVADYAGDIFPRIDLGFDHVDAPGFNFLTLARMRGLEVHTHLLPYLANPAGREVFPILKEFASLGNPAFVERDVKNRLRHLAGTDRFMLTVFFSASHFPYSPPWPYYRAFTVPGYRGLSKYSKFNRITQEEVITETDVRQIRGVFDGAALATDHAIAGILAELDRLGLSDKTIVIFFSDHGENLYEHEYTMGHGDHLRGSYSLRIPLIIRDPRADYPVKVVTSRVRATDIMPTLLEMVGMDPPAGLPAKSLVPMMRGNEPQEDLPVYAETGLWFVEKGPGFFQKKRIPYPDVTQACWFEDYFGHEIVLRDEYADLTEAAKHRMLMLGRWKVIYAPTLDGPGWELYDLESDPEQRHDLSAERPKELAEMEGRLFSLLLQRPGWTVEGGYYVPARGAVR